MLIHSAAAAVYITGQLFKNYTLDILIVIINFNDLFLLKVAAELKK